MINISGLLAKTLILVICVAVISLGASYTFVSIQQKRLFDDNISSIKHTHRKSARQLLEQHLQEQILSAEEIVMLSDLNNRPLQDFEAFFNPIWSRIQLSFSLSSMSFSNGQQSVEYGRFPSEDMFKMQMSAANELRPQSGIICHFVCELSSSIPVTIEGEQWALSLLSDIAPSIIFLSSVVSSDIGIISPSSPYSSQNNTLSRYVVDIMTGSEKNGEVFQMPLSSSQFEELEREGMHFKTKARDYYVWFETIDGIGQDIRLLFIRDISLLLEQQNNQKEQVIVIFATMTFGILLFLILFSFIPISKINQLKRAIKLIGAKEYNIARYRLGKPTKSHFNDELHELEDEFRHAIDVLETYEQQLKASQKRLVRQATIDQITGLFTRNVLVEDLINMNTDPSINEVAIFFLDLDGFKPVNDNLGHEAGDIMLKKIGYRLKGVVNKFTKVYRIGGDEFVICFSNFSSSESLDMMADSVVDLFCAPFHIYDTRISISASIGIAKQKGDEIDADKLLRFADIAMYQAKENGKNCYKFFDDSMRDAAQQRFTIKNDFIASLADNQLFIVFQPIVCSKTRKVTKLEALCRWQHPDLGFIPPPVFIDVLEESENMNMLFEWIVNNVVNEIHYLDSIERNDIIISINLSPSQLVNDLALSVINNVLDEHKISPKRIELEITETSLITNFETAKLWVEDATNAGYKIAIDDFGAGYSSLSYLTAFSYNTVKLDRSLLNNIDKDPRQQRIVGSLTQMLHGLSVPIVAEGAETEEQFIALQKLGCDYIQGYFTSKPIPHDQLVYFLNRYMSEPDAQEESVDSSVEK